MYSLVCYCRARTWKQRPTLHRFLIHSSFYHKDFIITLKRTSFVIKPTQTRPNSHFLWHALCSTSPMSTTTDNSTQVGFLVPVNKNLVEEGGGEIPRIPLSAGPNVVGRNCVPVTDKRLSRKHLTINASADGSAQVFVEGTNPVVIRSKDGRKKIASGQTWRILHEDVIEFIPGHYFFKYVVKAAEEKGKSPENSQKRLLSEESKHIESEARDRKKTREASEEEALWKKGKTLKNELHDNGQGTDNSSEENICHLNVPKEKIPLTFRLLRVRELPSWANTNAVSIDDVVQGDLLVAILSNYMVDIDWLLSACPALKKVPHVLVIHGEGDGALEYMKRKKPAGWVLHKPPLPISYGTHHSKAMLLIYPRGVRIIVHTANLIYVDWNNKSQGLWMQDFPWKDQNDPSKGCEFESDLIDYLSALKWPEFTVNFPDIGSFRINPLFFKKFDYSSAVVRLVASVPGYHSGPSLKKWGHMKLRTVLQECTFDKEFKKSPLVYQFSSLGSLDEKWMAELASSMSAGVSEDETPLGLGQPLIIWPTVEDVRCSLEGYAAGNAIPSPQKNVEKDFLKKYWARWKASHTGRCRAMPHIKSFTRYSGQNIAWFLLTSANLSKAAWGALQKNNSQLMIRSYELGVLFLPAAVKHGCDFSCTNNGKSSAGKSGAFRIFEEKGTKLVTPAWQGNRKEDKHEIIHLPVPYELPPKPYSPEDVPWSWDRRYTKKDVYGQIWPRQVQLYLSGNT